MYIYCVVSGYNNNNNTLGCASPALDELVRASPQLLAIALAGDGTHPLVTPDALNDLLTDASLPLPALEAALSCSGCRAHPAAVHLVSTLLRRVWAAETGGGEDDELCRLWEGLVERGADDWPEVTHALLRKALGDTLVALREDAQQDDDHLVRVVWYLSMTHIMFVQLLFAALVLDASRLMHNDAALVQSLATTAALARAVAEVAGGPSLLLDASGASVAKRAATVLQLECFAWLAGCGAYHTR